MRTKLEPIETGQAARARRNSGGIEDNGVGARTARVRSFASNPAATVLARVLL